MALWKTWQVIMPKLLLIAWRKVYWVYIQFTSTTESCKMMFQINYTLFTVSICECTSLPLNGKALQLHAAHIFYYKSHENPYQYHKLRVLHLNLQWNIRGDYHHSTKLYQEKFVAVNWHFYLCCALVTIQMSTKLWYIFMRYSFVPWWYLLPSTVKQSEAC